MKRWWWHCHRWGWIAYDGAIERGEAVAHGMAYAYFVDPTNPKWDGARASTGPRPDDD